MKNNIKSYREMEDEIILFDAETIATGNAYKEIEAEIKRREKLIHRQGVTTDPLYTCSLETLRKAAEIYYEPQIVEEREDVLNELSDA